MERKVKPIRADEIQTTKEDLIPDEVIESFNEMIIEKWGGNRSFFKKDEVIARIKTKIDIERQDIFDKHYLDVEKIYKDLGWEVKFESPSYGESDFESYFTFAKKEKE